MLQYKVEESGIAISFPDEVKGRATKAHKESDTARDRHRPSETLNLPETLSIMSPRN